MRPINHPTSALFVPLSDTAPQTPPLDPSEVEKYLSTIDDHLTRQIQIPLHRVADKKFLPAVIGLANQKHPGLNLHLEPEAPLFGARVKQLTEGPDTSARLIVNMGNDGIHYAAFDISKRNGQVSVIGVEPATLNAMGPALLAFRSQLSLGRELPTASFVMIESDLQRSQAECGMFSVALAKKMRQEEAAFGALHDKNRAGDFKSHQGMTSENVLPPLLMKHAQSQRRLQNYLADRPEAAQVLVNKRGETLEQRQARHLVSSDTGDKIIHYSNSIEVKRRQEMGQLLKQLQPSHGPFA